MTSTRGKTQYYTATSIDGFIADPDASPDWLFEADRASRDDEDRFGTFFAGVGAFAMGATTYEWVLRHERLLDEPHRWREMYGATPAWVFTHRQLPPIEGADVRFVHGDVTAAHVEMAEAAEGKNVWLVGGGDLVGQFSDADLLDEIIVHIAPVTLGAGAPLLPRRLTRLRLESAHAVGGTFAELRYTVAAGRHERP